MIPSNFFIKDNFPLTPNKKVDIDKLLNEIKGNSYDKNIKNGVQKAWQEVLNNTVNDFNQSFFEAGGDSLLLMKLQYSLEKNLKKNIELLDLVRYPTIQSFSNFINSEVTNEQTADI